MKQLIHTHRAELEEHTNLNLDSIGKIVYLHDFDREVQYDAPPLHTPLQDDGTHGRADDECLT